MQLTPKEASLVMGMNEEYVRQLLRSGRLAGDKVAGRWVTTLDAARAHGRLDVKRARLACRWLAEIAPRPKRAALVAELVMTTFAFGDEHVTELVASWLGGDADTAARAVARARARLDGGRS